MRERSEFPVRPDTFIVDPSEGAFIQDKIEAFFGEIIDYLGYGQAATLAFARVKSYELRTPTTETDDRITLLIIRDRLTAAVCKLRTDFNFVEVSFAHYLSPELVGLLKKGIVTK